MFVMNGEVMLAIIKCHKYQKLLFIITFSVCSLVSGVQASPWLEANDPYLRSSLLLLSDSGNMNAPVNQFPLRWSTIGDELNVIKGDSQELTQAKNHLLYTLNSEKFGRGSRVFKLTVGDSTPTDSGYGAYNHDEWGAQASYEQLEEHFAFRVASGYSKYQHDEDFTWNGSYVALNSESWLFSVGSLERWWGQGWQHNLILSSNARSSVDVGLSYMGQNEFLGKWNIESMLSKLDDANFDQRGALRIVSKPLSFFEYGFTYQSWFDDNNPDDAEQQSAFDMKISLPSFSGVYHSVYSELASTSDTKQLGSWLVGWSGQFDIFNQSLRIVFEKLESTNEKDESNWKYNQHPSTSKHSPKNSYMYEESWSSALYLQLENDHAMSMVVQSSRQQSIDITDVRLTYRMFSLGGMLQLGAGVTKESNTKESYLWTGYEFRF